MSTIKVTNIEHGSTTDGGIQLDSSGHVTIDGQQLPTAGPLSNRNMIINGAMQLSQRSTSATSVNSNGYHALDRYRMSINGWTITMAQSTDAPAGFSNSLKVDVTTANSSPSSGDYLVITTRIEGQDLQHLAFGDSEAKETTISFWVKSNKTGNASFNARQSDNSDKLFSAQYSISSADTWEHKTISIPADTSGVINNDTGNGIQLEWWLDSGSTYTGGSHAATWVTNDHSNRNSTNLGVGGSTDDEFYITGIQWEVGEKATPFEHRSYGDELVKCQRYYEKSYNQDTDPGTVTVRGAFQSRDGTASTVVRYYPVIYRVTKRANPSIVIYIPDTGNSGSLRMDSSNADAAISGNGDANTMVYSDDSGIPNHYGVSFHYTIESEL